ncbi:DUF3883 domain-containing protein [Maridesulfovibrio sp.]|uniref:DUF3883 domain-containing protein n=1 Tax=unclassified Maridesulfovibrio TaxID=2794999 RepID=UPI003AFF7DB1
MPKILYINIGWMNSYKGPVAGDNTTGNHGYLQDHDHGHECFNFKPLNGYCYGYVPGGRGANINRLGASGKDESIDEILVVWIARSPVDNLTYIVGWFEDAKVFRKPQDDLQEERNLHGNPYIYGVVAKENKTQLVPTDQRVFIIPSSRTVKHGFGQSSYWYADKRPDIQKATVKYIRNGALPNSSKKIKNGSSPRNNDPELRKTVEETAVNLAIYHYENLGFTVISKETEGVGWDLEARNDNLELFIEVKGLSGDTLSVEFTPNEYDKMREHHKKYVIFVVTEALLAPQKHIFRCYDENVWIDSNDNILNLHEKISAVGRCNTAN